MKATRGRKASLHETATSTNLFKAASTASHKTKRRNSISTTTPLSVSGPLQHIDLNRLQLMNINSNASSRRNQNRSTSLSGAEPQPHTRRRNSIAQASAASPDVAVRDITNTALPYNNQTAENETLQNGGRRNAVAHIFDGLEAQQLFRLYIQSSLRTNSAPNGYVCRP